MEAFSILVLAVSPTPGGSSRCAFEFSVSALGIWLVFASLEVSCFFLLFSCWCFSLLSIVSLCFQLPDPLLIYYS